MSVVSPPKVPVQQKMRVPYRISVDQYLKNLNDDTVEVYSQPSGPSQSPSYADRHDYARGDSVPLALDGLMIAMIPVAELLS